MLKELVLRPDTQDSQVLDEVLTGNCYCLPEWFHPDDIILDVGAHIGVFAMACLQRGAGKIVCVEPDPENLELLRANANGEPAIEIVDKALWNPAKETVRFHRRRDGYTAMGCVSDQGSMEVGVVGLDQLIHAQGGGSIRLLKLDCEGAEWPSLYKSESLGRVKQIVAELHLGMKVAGFACDQPSIYRHLKAHGFDVLVLPGKDPKYNWNLFAWRY